MRFSDRPITARAAMTAVLLAGATGILGGCGAHQDTRSERVVLVTIDTLRYEEFAGDDSTPSAMPRTRAFAERGLVFESSFSATSTTQPSHASLMTGLHPWQHGVTQNGHFLGADLETLAERLRAAGYSTRAVVSSFPLERRFGFAQGFEHYEDRFGRAIGKDVWMGQPLDERRFYALANRTTRLALSALEEQDDQDLFLWVHYFDPHDPYGDCHLGRGEPLPPDGTFSVERLRSSAAREDEDLAALVQRSREAYRCDLGFLDEGLGRLLERLEADSRRFTTHVVITADHGESFGEDGSFGHGTRLTPPQVRVPLAIVSPRVTPALRRDAAGSVDVFATLLDLADQPVPPGRGRSLLRPAGPEQGSAFGMRRTYLLPKADRRSDGTVRYVSEPSFYAVLEGKLLTGGPEGTIYVAPGGRLEEPARVREMHQLFRRFAEELERRPAQALDDVDVLEALEALGYAR